MLGRPVIIAAGLAVIIIALVVGGSLVGDLFRQRAELAREQRAREDREREADRARANYERDIGLVASIFDPLGLFH